MTDRSSLLTAEPPPAYEMLLEDSSMLRQIVFFGLELAYCPMVPAYPAMPRLRYRSWIYLVLLSMRR